MSNRAPLPIKQFDLFASLPLDAAVFLCSYLTIRDVEAMGSTCRAAREQFLKLKKRQDFWRSLVPIESPLQTDWSRPSPVVSLQPDMWREGGGNVELAMNAEGDYLFVHCSLIGLACSGLVAYRRTSQSPLKFARGIRCNTTAGMRMVGMDNDPTHPGVYLWQQSVHELWVWHAKRGLSLVGQFPEYSQLVAHSWDNILYMNAIQNNQLIAQRFKITDEGLLERVGELVQENMTHGNFLLKLSPGGESLMVIDRESRTLVVANSKDLKPRTDRVIRLENVVPEHLSDLSITDCGGTLFHDVAFSGQPKLSALDRRGIITLRQGNHEIWGRMAHSGDGRQVITTCLLYPVRRETYQCFTMLKRLPALLEEAISELLPLCPLNIDAQYVQHYLSSFLANKQIQPDHLRTLQAKLKGATPERLSAVSEAFCDTDDSQKRIDNLKLLFLYDLANCLDMEDEEHPIKNFQHYWSGNTVADLSALFDDYSRGKKIKHERMLRFVDHTRGHMMDPISLGHLLLDLCRRLPKGPTLAEVLCQSSNPMDRKFHKLIPKRLAQAMLSAPALCNYVILAALMKKIIAWTDDDKKKEQLKATHGAMVRASEADPDLRFNADRLMNDRHENCDTVFQCLQETPYYETMRIHFNVVDREHQHQEERQPRQWWC